MTINFITLSYIKFLLTFQVYCMFLDGALPCLTNLNLLLQRSDPIIHILYDVLFTATCTLLSRFMKPETVGKYRRGGFSNAEIKIAVEDPTNYLTYDKLFVGLLAKSKAKKLLEEGDISQVDVDKFYNACLQFHKAAFLYAINNFPLDNDVLKHSRFLNILQQQCSFESVLFLVERFQHYISFTKTEIVEMEEEFLCLQSLQLDDFTSQAKEEATIRVDEDGDSVTYRIDVLWYHLFLMKIPGSNRSKFHNLFKLVKVILVIIHSNAEEESLFSKVRKNLTAQRASLSLDGTLSSIISFQLNRKQGETCYQYQPSESVISKSKKVTWEYNKEHSFAHANNK